MKIHEYNQMMAYLTRPATRTKLNEGSKLQDLGNLVDIRNIPYIANKATEGVVNAAESLAKLPLAAGELGSQLLTQKPNKKMFTDALENITPGSWADAIGLSELTTRQEEGMSPAVKTAGSTISLTGEMFVPVGGAFGLGNKIIKNASSKIGPFKKGKNLEQVIDETLTARGEGRRDFNKVVASGGLMLALKSIGLGGIKATKTKTGPDAVLTLKTLIDDADEMTDSGLMAVGRQASSIDVSGLTDAVKKSLAVIMKSSRNKLGEKVVRNKVKGKDGKFTDEYEDISTEEAAYIMEELQKRGHNVKFKHYDDMGGQGVDDILDKFKNKDKIYGKDNYDKFSKKVAKMTEKEKLAYHSSITDDYGQYYDEFVEELLDMNFKKSGT